MRRKRFEVPVKKLRRTVNLRSVDKKKSIRDFIGQEKAKEALEFGLKIKTPGYNIFVTGLSHSGRSSMVEKFIRKFSEKENTDNLKDIVYVYNFKNPGAPVVLVFKKGEAIKFKKEIESLPKRLREKNQAVLASDEFLKEKRKILIMAENDIFSLRKQTEKEIKKLQLIIKYLPDKIQIIPMSLKDPKKEMDQEEFDNLPQDIKAEIVKRKKVTVEMLDELAKNIKNIREKAKENIRLLEEKYRKKVIDDEFSRFVYQDEKIKSFLNGLKNFILESKLFESKNVANQNPFALMVNSENDDNKYLPFKVNVLVDNSKQEFPPVVFENHPTFNQLFGAIRKKIVPGGYVTNHTMLRPGSLIKANGGYLIINALDALISPGVWRKLTRVLRTGYLKIEDLSDALGYAGSPLSPEPIPINVKLIVIGKPYIYYFLLENDPNFSDLFKVKVEFVSRMDLKENTIDDYVRFINSTIEKEKFLPITRKAVEKIIEYGIRITEDQRKLSTRFGKIKDLIIQANHWAKESGSKKITPDHVRKAIRKEKERVNSVEEAYKEFINRKKILIDIEGKKVGQVNGLAVLQIGDFSFGIPQKITVQSFAGREGVVSVQRQVGISGPTFNTAIEIIKGFLGARYAKKEPLSLTISISFEQTYGKIEGDSATIAEVSAILSSLSGIPINQSIAVTGSMNQFGEVQPVGGINEKIEGFFDICQNQKKGLTGNQGVIIPYQNVDSLMLREDIVEACHKGKFHIYAVKNIEQAIAILTGFSMKKIDKRIKKRLKE